MNTTILENERDYELITNIHQKLIFDKITPSKSAGVLLNELRQELNQLKCKNSDESKTSSVLDCRPVSTDRVRFDINVRDHDDWTTQSNTTSDKRSTTPLTHSRRKPSGDFSFNSGRKRKIRLKDSLEILENYHERYKTQINGKNHHELTEN